jgi:hypothetical protein
MTKLSHARTGSVRHSVVFLTMRNYSRSLKPNAAAGSRADANDKRRLFTRRSSPALYVWPRRCRSFSARSSTPRTRLSTGERICRVSGSRHSATPRTRCRTRSQRCRRGAARCERCVDRGVGAATPGSSVGGTVHPSPVAPGSTPPSYDVAEQESEVEQLSSPASGR